MLTVDYSEFAQALAVDTELDAWRKVLESISLLPHLQELAGQVVFPERIRGVQSNVVLLDEYMELINPSLGIPYEFYEDAARVPAADGGLAAGSGGVPSGV